MAKRKTIGKVSESPTIPSQRQKATRFDVKDLYQGVIQEEQKEISTSISYDEKLRQAYFWITNYAVISPYYDIEYNSGPKQSYRIGDLKSEISLPSSQSYSSFVLLPLLNLIVRRRCLLIGGPGRGKNGQCIPYGDPSWL